jgi:class 3 adenylate cyclase/tetratricopeptide (TPR) repeat protein
MSCPVCFAATDSSDRFCGRCGYGLSRTCKSCGQSIQPGDQFCRSCGQELGPDSTAQTGHVLSITGTLGATQPPGVQTVVGEHKVVTVLFADVVGSTRLIEHLGPEQSMKLLEPALQVMFDAVRRYGGTINRVQGDGIMALFGAPVAREDHAVRACLSALQLARAACGLAGRGISIRIGINSGPVVVRSFGNDMSINYDAVGATVHLAARMEQTCEPGSIRLAAGTFRLAERAIVARAQGAVTIKGLSAPIEVYELLDRAPARQRGSRNLAAQQSRFINRSDELAFLRQAMELCAVGFGQVVSIIGPPGIGKSRVVREFARSVVPDSWQRLETACTPYDQNTTYYPLKTLLRHWCEIDDSGDYAAATEAVRRALKAVGEPLLGDLSPICSLLDLPVEDPGWEQLDPQMRQRRIVGSVCNLLIALSQARPLVIHVEDLHWIDAETRSVLEELSRRIGEATCLLLVTARPDSVELQADEANYRRIDVQGLDPRHAISLSDDLMGADGSLDDLKQRIVERTGGIPLFIEETISSLIAAHDIERARRGYRLTRQLEAIRIPDTLQALVSSRIDQLAPEPKAILQLASVIGNEAPAVLLSHIAGTAEDRLSHALRRLETSDFLRRTESGRDTVFAFRHAIVRDVAYKSLLEDQRSALHRSVVDAIEANYRNRHDEHIERLAHHAFAGELWDKAADYSRKAADKAYERSALHDAVNFLEQALSALEQLPANREFLARAIETRIRLRKALWTLGRVEDADAHLDRAEALAALLDDKRKLAEISVIRAQILNSQGEVDRAIAAGLKACEVSAAIGNEAFLMGAKFFLSQSYYFRGDLRQGVEVLEPLRQQMIGRLRHERLATIITTSVLHLVNLARTHTLLGEFDTAAKHADEAREIARETSRPFDIGFASHASGVVAVVRGDFKETVRVLEPAFELCEAHELVSLFPLVSSPLGLAHTCLGNSNYGGALLGRAVEVAGRSRLTFFRVWSATYLARAYHETGAVEETLAVAQEALAEAVTRSFRALEVRLRWLVGSATGYGDPMAGLDQLRQAVSLATELEMRPDLAHSRRAVATIYYRLGRESEADVEQAAAFGLYKQLGMKYGQMPSPPVSAPRLNLVKPASDRERARR